MTLPRSPGIPALEKEPIKLFEEKMMEFLVKIRGFFLMNNFSAIANMNEEVNLELHRFQTNWPELIEAVHDFRNVLGGMLPLGDLIPLMEDPVAQDEIKARFKELLESADLLLQSLCNKLQDPKNVGELELSKHIARTVKSLAAYVLGADFVADSSRNSFQTRDAAPRKFILSVEPNLVVLSNWPAFFRALQNLLVNARVHNPSGPLSVSLTAARSSVPGYIHVKVADNGKGIDPENESRVFESGWTTGAPGISSGLGLAIVRDTLQQSGASITLNGHGGPEGGAEFTILLPSFPSNQ